MTTPTPGPWKAIETSHTDPWVEGRPVGLVIDTKGSWVAVTINHNETALANSRLIAKACNSYDEMRHVCESIASFYESRVWQDTPGMMEWGLQAIARDARAALAKAGEPAGEEP